MTFQWKHCDFFSKPKVLQQVVLASHMTPDDVFSQNWNMSKSGQKKNLFSLSFEQMPVQEATCGTLCELLVKKVISNSTRMSGGRPGLERATGSSSLELRRRMSLDG